MQVLSVGNRSRRVESIAGWQCGDSAVLWSRERGGGRASLSQIWHPSKRIRALSFRRGEILWKYLRVSLFWSRAIVESRKTFFKGWRDSEKCWEWPKEREETLNSRRVQPQLLKTQSSYEDFQTQHKLSESGMLLEKCCIRFLF